MFFGLQNKRKVYLAINGYFIAFWSGITNIFHINVHNFIIYYQVEFFGQDQTRKLFFIVIYLQYLTYLRW